VKASIITPVLNRWDLTEVCLYSLRDTAPEAELIVIDNGSTDDTLANITSGFRDVAVLHFDSNQGFAKGCNAGAKIAGGEVLVFLNNDTVAHPGWLDPLVEALSDPSIWVAGSLLLYPDGTVQHAGMTALRTLQFFHVHQRKDPDSIPGIRRAKDLQAVTGACIAIRKADFAKLGGFDENYVNGFEDVDLCMRARRDGGRVRYEPRSVLTHYEGQTEGRFAAEFLNIRTFYSRWRREVRFDHDRVVAEDEKN